MGEPAYISKKVYLLWWSRRVTNIKIDILITNTKNVIKRHGTGKNKYKRLSVDMANSCKSFLARDSDSSISSQHPVTEPIISEISVKESQGHFPPPTTSNKE